MGYLIEGEWHRGWLDTASTGGRFVREDAGFRNRVTADGSSPYPAEAGRYHLYVSHACPWCHRLTIVRKLKKLEDVVSVSVADPHMDDDGWRFAAGADTVIGAKRMHEVYTRGKPDFTGRATVPVLWDKKTGSIVSNESGEILRMLNSAFDGLSDEIAEAIPDLYPQAQRSEIDALNEMIYDTVNNGVYKCGFATTQEAYEASFGPLFETLDRLEERLGSQRYLTGNQITEADWRLFVTLLRFDPVYHYHFKCNRNRIADFPNLFNYLRDLYQAPGVAATCHMDQIKAHYYTSHPTINPSGIIPLGPEIDLTAPHDRDRFGG